MIRTPGSRTLHGWFGTSPRHRFLFAVIHMSIAYDAANSADVALRSGADGLFLINQGAAEEWTLDTLASLRENRPGVFLGVNLLGAEPDDTLRVCRYHGVVPDAIWTDGLTPGVSDPDWAGLHFGGVAFKGQPSVPKGELGRAYDEATGVCDVPTTSGTATGVPAPVGKIHTLGAAAQSLGRPLAIASGITAENVECYLPFANAFLVGTGIEKSFGVICPLKTGQLAHLIDEYNLDDRLGWGEP